MTELKPCPFCGSKHIKIFGKNSHWVECGACGAEGPFVTDATLEEAIAAWNQREAVAAMRHRIGKLASGEAQEIAGLQLIIGEDGKARLYDDTYDIVIHCESIKKQERAVRLIKSINGMQKLKARGENECENE